MVEGMSVVVNVMLSHNILSPFLPVVDVFSVVLLVLPYLLPHSLTMLL